ncbi:PAS domain-containing sensor histidine kinase [Roseisolibacter agri]|uniref:histidine kinase n=1 Tax=Roseisolibacter agri TaxID=2014610 RepID=A0AA37V5C1_9BACT|nr:ATP-binding protein [Roseisolibacter agri]GLC23951.1 hypothetical protein rosag_04640 [Roseisolibacter agri]
MTLRAAPAPVPAPVPDAALRAAFPGDSDMAARCRALDWSRTPLGPVEGWPHALRAAVRMALECPFPINLWCGDAMVLIYNDGYRRVLGAKHPEALGQPGAQVWAEIWEDIAPMFAAIRAGGPAYHFEDQRFVMARGDAEDEAWFTYALSPVRDESGAVVAFLNVVSETTARIRAEQATNEARTAAERAESRMREVFEQAPVAVCVLEGPSHVYGLVNPLYQRFLPGRELRGHAIRDALPELAGQGVFELLDTVYATGRPHVASEFPLLVDRDGDGTMHEAVFSFVYQPVRDATGAVSAIAVVATDVTELVQARRSADALRAQAEEANAAKSDFLAMMSHELRTPLNAIGGYAQLLELGVHGPILPAQRDALARIQSSQQHLLGLINAVLNYAKLEAGRVQYDLEPVRLADALREVEALMAGQAHAKGLELTPVDVAACATLTATADREKLRQVLLNLVSNAIKFTDPSGRVSMACAAADGMVRVSVRDTGRGIPPDRLDAIFEPFVQVGRSFATPDAGTGLGLAISRDLARGMGGDLTVESRVGVGSTFTITLREAT